MVEVNWRRFQERTQWKVKEMTMLMSTRYSIQLDILGDPHKSRMRICKAKKLVKKVYIYATWPTCVSMLSRGLSLHVSVVCYTFVIRVPIVQIFPYFLSVTEVTGNIPNGDIIKELLSVFNWYLCVFCPNDNAPCLFFSVCRREKKRKSIQVKVNNTHLTEMLSNFHCFLNYDKKCLKLKRGF